jgi:hypothetical protein
MPLKSLILLKPVRYRGSSEGLERVQNARNPDDRSRVRQVAQADKQEQSSMTPKEAYEARKAERAKLRDLEYQAKQREEQVMTLDMLDRFVTAVERIADALDKPKFMASPSPHEWVAGSNEPTVPLTTAGMSVNGVG